MASAWYCTREMVKNALDSKRTSRDDWNIDRAIEAASRAVEGLTHRRFYPWTGIRYFDWPSDPYSRPWRLWLNQHELVSISSLSAAGIAIPPADYFLRPIDGPPYTRVEIDLGSSSAFQSGLTHQQAIAIDGVWYRLDEEQIGDLDSSLGGTPSSTASITWTTPRVGVGDILRIDSERMIVINKSFVDSGQNLGGSLAASNAVVTVPVASGPAFASEDTLLIDSERMLVTDVAGNNLTVRRAWDGSVLAAHNSGADVYVLRGVELARAQLGTAIAAHSTGADVYRHLPPALVRELTIAEAINTLLQESAGYGRTVGSGDSEREMGGKGIASLRDDVYTRYGRKARIRAI